MIETLNGIKEKKKEETKYIFNFSLILFSVAIFFSLEQANRARLFAPGEFIVYLTFHRLTEWASNPIFYPTLLYGTLLMVNIWVFTSIWYFAHNSDQLPRRFQQVGYFIFRHSYSKKIFIWRITLATIAGFSPYWFTYYIVLSKFPR